MSALTWITGALLLWASWHRGYSVSWAFIGAGLIGAATLARAIEPRSTIRWSRRD